MARGQVRANWLKLVVGTAKRRTPAERDLILAVLPDHFRNEIREASSLAWIAVERFAEVHDGIRQVLGDERARTFWRQVMLDGMQRPLLRPLRSGAIGMFGETPGALLRFTPHAWSLVTRHCATVEYLSQPPSSEAWTGGCRLRFSNLDPAMRPEVFEPLFVGGAGAAVELLGFDGVTRRRMEAPRDTVEVSVEWRPRTVTTMESVTDEASGAHVI